MRTELREFMAWLELFGHGCVLPSAALDGVEKKSGAWMGQGQRRESHRT